jgi:cell division protein FtsQ
MKNKWRILKIFVTIVILGFLLSFSLKRFAQKPLENIAVNLKQTPVYFLDEKDIRKLVNEANPSRKIGDVDVAGLESKLNALPSVDSANVYLGLNGTLHIDIKQKVPVFRLHNGPKECYVDEKGNEFPINKSYSHPCMLVVGDVKKEEYQALGQLIKKIDADDFNKKYFIGIAKVGSNYNLLTSEGNFKVEIGDLENIDFKVKGFKSFVEKFLIYQDPQKYTKVSVKYNNQIVTTLNPYFAENDSLLKISKTEFDKANEIKILKKNIDIKPANSGPFRL